jgi:GAF domain-containing protein
MTDEPPLAAELTGVFVRMSRLLLSEETVDTALRLVTSLAQETIHQTAGAGVTVGTDGKRSTAAASDRVVERADDLQYGLDEGPCLTAWRDRVLVRIDEVRTERRWPRWTRAVEPLGIRSSMSTPLIVSGDTLGAIKVYSRESAAYDTHDERLLQLFAEQAAILLANVQSYENARRLSAGLQEALRTRDVIGQAKGILMAQEGIDEAEAFAVLVRASQRSHQKLREVARQLIEVGARRS